MNMDISIKNFFYIFVVIIMNIGIHCSRSILYALTEMLHLCYLMIIFAFGGFFVKSLVEDFLEWLSSEEDNDNPNTGANNPSNPDGNDPKGDDSDGDDPSNSSDDSSNSGGSDPNDVSEKLDKGKGKATEIPPDELAWEKEREEYRKKIEQEDLERERKAKEAEDLDLAKRQSLYDEDLKKKAGQSSKAPEGGYFRYNEEQEKELEFYKKSGELSKQNQEFPQKEESMDYREIGIQEYELTEDIRKQHTRLYNDIMQKIDESGDKMDEREKADLLNESIKVRGIVDDATKHAKDLKDNLGIPSDAEMYDSEEYDSEQDSGQGYSSDENKSSEEESRPSKRPRN